MDLLDLLSLAGRFWPRLVGAVVVFTLLFFPHTATSVLWRAARDKGAEISSLLERAIDPTLPRGPHPSKCHDHPRCPR